MNSGPPKTNPSSGSAEDLNPGPLDYKSSDLPLGHACLPPANEKIACMCSQTASQSALHSLSSFTFEIPVDLHLQFSQAAGLKRLFLFRTNFASNFRRLREQTNSRTFPVKSFGGLLYSVSFVQSKENSCEKPRREINLKDTSHAVRTGSNASFNCLLSQPVLKQVTHMVQFLQKFFPKPLCTANPRQLTPPKKKNVFSFCVTIKRYETVMQFPMSLFGNSRHCVLLQSKL